MSEGWEFDVQPFFSQLDPRNIGERAAQRVLAILGGKPVKTQKCPVVFDAQVAGELLAYLGAAMTAEAMQKGRSFLQGKLGQDIASDKVTLIDNGRMPRGWGA
ncbi:MAG: TldD/PmbA family protein, partial [Anaerolineae bacterium]|nr:TldD/PmbA family protein [Anaerolineae bacterium]